MPCHRALILAPFDDAQLRRLRPHVETAHESWLDTRKLTNPDELASRLVSGRFSILIVEADFVFEEIFEDGTPLRFVGVCRGSIGHIDVDAATASGVLVVNTPGRNAQAVAEHALGLMLAVARNIPASHQYVKEGRWENPVEPYVAMRGVELYGKTLGLIGLGAIGRRLSAIGMALGMHVMACDPYAPVLEGVSMASLDAVLSEADFLSIHVPLTDETDGLLDEKRLPLMKKTAYLVNCSEASVIERAALVAALERHELAGAALDVFETHPVAPDNPLLALDSVVLSPHIGGATAETVERHSQMMTDDVLRFVDGKRPVNLANPEVWDRRAG
ncbi:MAG: hypothetical protein FI707_03205 [SAR202 cluster bacterium]|jgi:phosphoglycerate dehydrogenase-like enzyme|nr:NAD(P)-dependent oxidoreductase [SAR202 cluster bacterium]MDP6799220.1 NAD(P)-dependent oxidoreductase [SAR202 cluster bacterium]MQG57729.1 hypothetical protein [SAR202 cluster bacterium]MQG67781.1 hypothetical protein [SAR202 cluster bacterium]|tara:strand:- start:14050 stop:15045 length:996 start_codon:yes stop_codon:yes gene_type:complete